MQINLNQLSSGVLRWIGKTIIVSDLNYFFTRLLAKSSILSEIE
jgi:hypothetical protein